MSLEQDKVQDSPEVFKLKLHIKLLHNFVEPMLESLKFAALHIKAGKPWDEQCDIHIGNMLGGFLPREENKEIDLLRRAAESLE